MKQIRQPKSFDELTIIDDYMFFRVMQKEDLCKELLRRILKGQIGEIASIHAQKDFKESYASHGIRVDILVKTTDGKVYDVEMQAERETDLPRRIRYYQSTLDQELLDKNQRYRKLPNTYIIFLCPFDLLKKGLPVYTFRTLCTEDTTIHLEDGTTKIIVNSAASNKEESPELKAVMDYMNGKVTDDPFITELEKAVLSVKRNDEWRKDYMSNTAWYQDAVEEGIDIGREEAFLRMVGDGRLSAEEAAEYLGVLPEQLREKLQEQPLAVMQYDSNTDAIIHCGL